jgi:very-short-patch-repair endonuclease
LTGADATTLGPFRIAAATRTLIDLAGVVSEEALEIALDSAMRNGLTSIPYLTARLNNIGSQGRRGCGTLARLLAQRARLGGLESPLETKFLRLVRSAGLPLPEAGFAVGRYRIDFAYPQAKLGVELEGLDYHSGRQALNRDKTRRNHFADHGWVILYFTWDDVTKQPRGVLGTLRNHLFPRLVR